ncbi:hypothetical protein TsFJ059_002347 [Trichoderma semiorbis]|uniref:FAD-binding domain-containing protein n=1 Tax=Trichoderma semiorbis TaxID=1491008 RepID=A0A9P8HEL7_9HYPO|nr:hypothetical protein TsFJ059_002347 [Trichoderma semiorbis]
MAPSTTDSIANSEGVVTKKATFSISSIKTASYPTRSLEFLQKLDETATSHGLHNGSSQLNGGSQTSPLLFKVIVVGAGLGGLATAIALARKGHVITVLEQAPALGEVGAGIQVPPNSARLLLKWGLGPLLGDRVVEPEGITFRRWSNGKPIGYTKLQPDFRSSFGAPYYVVHRAHLHDALHQLALQLGVDVRVNHKVIEYNEENPSVKVEDGTILSADLIIAADGVKSLARNQILRHEKKEPIRTGFAAYRATVDVEKMRDDPDTAWLLEKPALNIWIGPERHVMTYTIASGKSFNMVLSHIDHSDPSTWRPETAIDDMRAYFEGWDPKLFKVISKINKTLKWPLMSGDASISHWVAQSGKLLMLGDAAHAMVPYMSQGAAMAVEDGAALATSLSHVTDLSELPKALSIFETERMKRSGQMQEASLVNGKLWHFEDGPEQQARDEAMRPEVEGRHFIQSPNQWSDPVTQAWAYGYDAEEEIEKRWKQSK